MNTTLPNGFRRRLFVGMLVPAIAVLAGVSVSGQPPQDSTRAVRAAATAKGAQAALDDATRRLKTGDINGFIEFYFPVNDLRDAREGELGKSFTQIRTPANIAALIKRLEKARSVEPEINLGGFIATFAIPEDKSERPAEVPSKTEPDEPSLPLPDGYAGNLVEAVAQAIADLGEGKLEQFVVRIFPPGELQHRQSPARLRQLATRLQQNPEMIEQMKRELNFVLDSKQIKNVTGNTASIALPDRTIEVSAGRGTRRMQLPERIIRFERIDDSWRFADKTTELRQTQQKVAAMSPASLAAFGVSDNIVMERFGDRWRFLEF